LDEVFVNVVTRVFAEVSGGALVSDEDAVAVVAVDSALVVAVLDEVVVNVGFKLLLRQQTSALIASVFK
jgi:hypothetical protein